MKLARKVFIAVAVSFLLLYHGQTVKAQVANNTEPDNNAIYNQICSEIAAIKSQYMLLNDFDPKTSLRIDEHGNIKQIYYSVPLLLLSIYIREPIPPAIDKEFHTDIFKLSSGLYLYCNLSDKDLGDAEAEEVIEKIKGILSKVSISRIK